MKKKVLEYNVMFQKEKDGGYSAWVPTLPGCTSQGETFEETSRNIQEAIELYLEDRQEEETSRTKDQFMVTVTVPQ